MVRSCSLLPLLLSVECCVQPRIRTVAHRMNNMAACRVVRTNNVVHHTFELELVILYPGNYPSVSSVPLDAHAKHMQLFRWNMISHDPSGLSTSPDTH